MLRGIIDSYRFSVLGRWVAMFDRSSRISILRGPGEGTRNGGSVPGSPDHNQLAQRDRLFFVLIGRPGSWRTAPSLSTVVAGVAGCPPRKMSNIPDADHCPSSLSLSTGHPRCPPIIQPRYHSSSHRRATHAPVAPIICEIFSTILPLSPLIYCT